VENAVCIECLRCHHRGIIEAEALAHHGLPPDASVAELSRRLVCSACGSHAMRAFRTSLEDAARFLEV
jgi:hypothetical protein